MFEIGFEVQFNEAFTQNEFARFLESISDKWIEFGSSIPASDTIGIEDGVVDAGKALKKINYRDAFFKYNSKLKGKVVVHHSVEQQVLTKVETRGLFTYEEINSIENLRGIPKDVNADLHLSKIRKEWNRFYKEVPNPTKTQILEKAKQIDSQYGHLFQPKVK